MGGKVAVALCVTGVLWGRSYFGGDEVLWRRHHLTDVAGNFYDYCGAYLHVGDGAVSVAVDSGQEWQPWGTPSTENSIEYARLNADDEEASSYIDPGWEEWRWRAAGVWVTTYHPHGTGTYGTTRELRVPFWLIAAGIALVGMRGLRRARRAEGACRRCGYDLRATPVRCPECGEAAVETVG